MVWKTAKGRRSSLSFCVRVYVCNDRAVRYFLCCTVSSCPSTYPFFLFSSHSLSMCYFITMYGD